MSKSVQWDDGPFTLEQDCRMHLAGEMDEEAFLTDIETGEVTEISEFMIDEIEGTGGQILMEL